MCESQEYLVTSFDQLNAFFDRHDRFDHWVYRGQSDASWPLLPKIARSPVVKEVIAAVADATRANAETESARRRVEAFDARFATQPPPLVFAGEEPSPEEVSANLRVHYTWVLRNILMDMEALSLHYWKRLASRFVTAAPTSDWQWLALGQHFGLATRLLDWTDNPLAAAYFALSTPTHDVDAALYALHGPRELDEDADRLFFSGVSLYRPPPMIDRIALQHALFSVEPPPFGPLKPEEDWMQLVRAVIPSACREPILRKIISFGVDSSMLFSDFSGAASHVNWLVDNQGKAPALRHALAAIRTGKEEDTPPNDREPEQPGRWVTK